MEKLKKIKKKIKIKKMSKCQKNKNYLSFYLLFKI